MSNLIAKINSVEIEGNIQTYYNNSYNEFGFITVGYKNTINKSESIFNIATDYNEFVQSGYYKYPFYIDNLNNKVAEVIEYSNNKIIIKELKTNKLFTIELIDFWVCDIINYISDNKTITATVDVVVDRLKNNKAYKRMMYFNEPVQINKFLLPFDF